MKKHLLRVAAVISLAFGAVVLFSGAGQIAAQNSNETTTNSTNTLQLSPVRSDLTIAPGKTDKVMVKITNLTDSDLVVEPIANDFVAGDERGTPALILDEDEFAPTHSLKRFMSVPGNVTIAADSSKEVPITINVPADAQPGGYYGAVRFQPVNGEGSEQVNVNASAASLILMTVPGDVVEKLNLTDFEVQQGGEAGTIFQSANDLQLFFRLENKGNIQEGPFGNITVKQGEEVVHSQEFNAEQPRDVVLPDSARRWNVPLKNIGSFGNYTVTATLTYGQDNKTIEAAQSFWIIPWSVIAAAVGGTLLLIGLIVGGRYFLKSYKRRILRSHGGGGLGLR